MGFIGILKRFSFLAFAGWLGLASDLLFFWVQASKFSFGQCLSINWLSETMTFMALIGVFRGAG